MLEGRGGRGSSHHGHPAREDGGRGGRGSSHHVLLIVKVSIEVIVTNSRGAPTQAPDTPSQGHRNRAPADDRETPHPVGEPRALVRVRAARPLHRLAEENQRRIAPGAPELERERDEGRRRRRRIKKTTILGDLVVLRRWTTLKLVSSTWQIWSFLKMPLAGIRATTST